MRRHEKATDKLEAAKVEQFHRAKVFDNSEVKLINGKRNSKETELKRSSRKERKGNALAPDAEEGRGKLR